MVPMPVETVKEVPSSALRSVPALCRDSLPEIDQQSGRVSRERPSPQVPVELVKEVEKELIREVFKEARAAASPPAATAKPPRLYTKP